MMCRYIFVARSNCRTRRLVGIRGHLELGLDGLESLTRYFMITSGVEVVFGIWGFLACWQVVNGVSRSRVAKEEGLQLLTQLRTISVITSFWHEELVGENSLIEIYLKKTGF